MLRCYLLQTYQYEIWPLFLALNKDIELWGGLCQGNAHVMLGIQTMLMFCFGGYKCRNPNSQRHIEVFGIKTSIDTKYYKARRVFQGIPETPMDFLSYIPMFCDFSFVINELTFGSVSIFDTIYIRNCSVTHNANDSSLSTY